MIRLEGKLSASYFRIAWGKANGELIFAHSHNPPPLLKYVILKYSRFNKGEKVKIKGFRSILACLGIR